MPNTRQDLGKDGSQVTRKWTHLRQFGAAGATIGPSSLELYAPSFRLSTPAEFRTVEA
jgi:hypothetical protein